ncbi:MAG TPA: potassium channel protein [Acidobacteria bacterium]|nr:potassium channel protein [Acidobacteriota bacterium]
MKRTGLPHIYLGHPLLAAALAVGTLLAAGTLAFKLAGGPSWSLLDAFYMSVITVTTVGYAEVHPLTTAGRMVAVVLILVGTGLVIYILGSLSEAVIRGRMFWRRRTLRRIQQMSQHYIVCGYGRVGRAVCQQIAEHGGSYVVVNREDPPTAQAAAWVVGDATDDEILRQAGIERARGLVTALGSDAENIYTVLAARTLNPGLLIVARCGEDRSARKLLAAGADRVLNPYERGGQLIAQVMLRPKVVDFIDAISQGVGIDIHLEQVEVAHGSSLVGSVLRDSPIRRELDIIVTAILKAAGEKLFNPSPDEPIEAGDVLIAMGRPAALDRLARLAAGAGR